MGLSFSHILDLEKNQEQPPQPKPSLFHCFPSPSSLALIFNWEEEGAFTMVPRCAVLRAGVFHVPCSTYLGPGCRPSRQDVNIGSSRAPLSLWSHHTVFNHPYSNYPSLIHRSIWCCCSLQLPKFMRVPLHILVLTSGSCVSIHPCSMPPSPSHELGIILL